MPLPEALTVREGLQTGAADRGLAVENADLVSGLQACVRGLIGSRVKP